MATRVKRLAAGVLLLAALTGIGAGTAGAQTAASATFSSPSSAPATLPIWVRSITPCPTPTTGVTSFVEAQLRHAIDLTEGDKVWGTVRQDGHWDVTLPAPGGPSGGATGRYLIEVQCGTTKQPPVVDPALATTITREYVSRTLEVTSGAATGAEWLEGPVGGVATTTTTTTEPEDDEDEDEDEDEAGDLEVPGTGTATASAVTSTTVGVPTKSLVSAAEIQAEIVERAASNPGEITYVPEVLDEGVALNASPASAARTADEPSGGIPAWSFACAAMLAVGAVIAWGQRRSAIELVASADPGVDE